MKCGIMEDHLFLFVYANIYGHIKSASETYIKEKKILIVVAECVCVHVCVCARVCV